MLRFFGLGMLVAVFFVVWRKLREARQNRIYQNKGLFGRPNAIQPNGLAQLSVEEYTEQMLEATEREKARLFASEEYKEAMRRKGPRQSAWNW